MQWRLSGCEPSTPDRIPIFTMWLTYLHHWIDIVVHRKIPEAKKTRKSLFSHSLLTGIESVILINISVWGNQATTLYGDWFLTQLPLDKMATISQMTFSNAFPSTKSFVFWLEFHWSLFLSMLRVQLTIKSILVQVMARCQTGDKPLPEPMLT